MRGVEMLLRAVCCVGLVFLGCVDRGTSASAQATSGARGELGDGGVSSFYRYNDVLPSTPGTLLRQEPLSPDLSLDGAAESLRLLYSSTEGLNGKEAIAVSAGLFLPHGDPPESGWPLLLWSHGTVGIADVCAPSWTGYVKFHQEHLNGWLQEGYAIVASDYQGLGTKGTHPYLATRPAAFSNLDAVRSVQSADFPVSAEFVVLGQSQGAGAALATAGYAKDYAPELRLLGVVATGVPYFTPEALVAVQEARPRDRVDPMLGYNFLALSLVEELDPSFDASDYVFEEVLPTARAVQRVCNRQMRSKIQELGLTYETTFKKSPPLEIGFAKMQFPTVSLSIPVFVGVGSIDRDTPPRMQARFVKAACDAGSTVAAHVYEGYDHLRVLNRSRSDSAPFVEALFSAAELPGNCDDLPFAN